MTIQNIINKGLCLGCGICTYDSSINKMAYCESKGMYIPLYDSEKELTIANKICPGKGYSIVEDAKLFYQSNKYSIELGFFYKLYAAHSQNTEILKKASSGGVMTELLVFLLNNKIVDKVAVTKIVYTSKGPKTSTFLTNNIEEILNSQGSKYCPVDISGAIEEIKRENCRIAYLGTPCQIAGIRQIQKIDEEFNLKIVLTIANFCGGVKSFNQIKKISRRHHINYNDITLLRFRGGGQPGGMVIDDKSLNHFEASYKKYGGFTGYSKLLRCHLCVDATGELADIACGDAWLDNYLKDSSPWSVIITRNKNSSYIIDQMAYKSNIITEPLTEEQVCLSQVQNLKSKKIRQFSRFRLYKTLGYSLPVYNGGYYTTPTPLKTELLIYTTHKLKTFIEIIGLYKYFRILIGKEY